MLMSKNSRRRRRENEKKKSNSAQGTKHQEVSTPDEYVDMNMSTDEEQVPGEVNPPEEGKGQEKATDGKSACKTKKTSKNAAEKISLLKKKEINEAFEKSAERIIDASVNNTSANNQLTLEQLRTQLTELNNIKDEMAKLPLDFREREYFTYYVEPLLSCIDRLTFSEYDLSYVVYNLNMVSLTRTSRLKDPLKMIFGLNDLAEDVFEVLDDVLEELLKIYETR